jgi:hypothetical protein
MEVVFVSNTTSHTVTVTLLINRVAGGALPLVLNFNRVGRLREHNVPSGSVYGHPCVPEALAVGAIRASDTGFDTIESFSSHGPCELFFPTFAVRTKPDVAAADGVQTSLSGFQPFFGTSAAAPHAAGVAALMFANGLTTPAQIRLGMTRTALDIEAAGVDRDSGAGIVNALAAVGFGVSPVVTVVATDASAGEPGTGQGTGTFTFTRTGSTAAALTVNFTVGGTATSGSDYTSIGTNVTFAAGSSTATKTVSVLDDLLVETNETVIVTLAPKAGYVIGSPSSATVTIQSDDPPVTPHLAIQVVSKVGNPQGSRLSDTAMTTSEGCMVHLRVYGPASQPCQIFASEDLKDWTVIGEAVPDAAGWVDFTDPDAAIPAKRFYRVGSPLANQPPKAVGGGR